MSKFKIGFYASLMLNGILVGIILFSGQRDEWQRDWLYHKYATSQFIAAGTAMVAAQSSEDLENILNRVATDETLMQLAKTDEEKQIGANIILYAQDLLKLVNGEKASPEDYKDRLFILLTENNRRIKEKWGDLNQKFLQEEY